MLLQGVVGVAVYLVVVAAQGDSAQELDFRLPLGLTTQLPLALVGPDHQETPEVLAVEILYFLPLLRRAAVAGVLEIHLLIQLGPMAVLAAAAHIPIPRQTLLLPPVVAAIHHLFPHLKEVTEGQGTQVRQIMEQVVAAGLVERGQMEHLRQEEMEEPGQHHQLADHL